MPEMNGKEFIEELKKYSEYKNIPIILVTQRTDTKHGKDEKYKIFDKIFHKGDLSNFVAEI